MFKILNIILASNYTTLFEALLGLSVGGLVPLVAESLFLIVWCKERKSRIPSSSDKLSEFCITTMTNGKVYIQ